MSRTNDLVFCPFEDFRFHYLVKKAVITSTIQKTFYSLLPRS